jgi:hypothetical protein
VASQKRYYQDFLNDDEAIATNVLADRLDHLVEHERLVDPHGRFRASQGVIHRLPCAPWIAFAREVCASVISLYAA